jgi:hypothetical protein
MLIRGGGQWHVSLLARLGPADHRLADAADRVDAVQIAAGPLDELLLQPQFRPACSP